MNLAQLLILGRVTKRVRIQDANYMRFEVMVKGYKGVGERFYNCKVYFKESEREKIEGVIKGDLIMIDGIPEVMGRGLGNEIGVEVQRWRVLK